MQVQIHKSDVQKLSFGSRISLITENGEDKKAVVIKDGITFKNGEVIKFSNIQAKQLFLGWK